MRKTALLVVSLLLAGFLSVSALPAGPAQPSTDQQLTATAQRVDPDPQLQAALHEISRGGTQMSTIRPTYPRTWVCSISCLPCGGIGGFCPRGTGTCMPHCP
jgi:hypothetical protein